MRAVVCQELTGPDGLVSRASACPDQTQPSASTMSPLTSTLLGALHQPVAADSGVAAEGLPVG